MPAMLRPQAPLVFVAGAPRSGTTFLASVLRAHPLLHIHTELRVLELAGIAGAMARGGAAATPEAFSPVDLQLGRPYVLDLLRRLQDRAGAAVTGDKFPPYNRQLRALYALFPGCKVIHIFRDGRDVVASAMYAQATGRGWRKDPALRGVHALASRWADDLMETFGQAGPWGSRVIHLRYEDLMQAPAAVVARLCAFLEVPTHPAFLAAAQGARAVTVQPTPNPRRRWPVLGDGRSSLRPPCAPPAPRPRPSPSSRASALPWTPPAPRSAPGLRPARPPGSHHGADR